MLTTSVAAACPYGVSTGVPLDPCADYLHLKDQERIRKDDILGVWIVTGFAEVTSLLRHPGLSSAWPDNGRTVLHDTSGAPEKRRTDGIVRRWFMFNDGERHPCSPRNGCVRSGRSWRSRSPGCWPTSTTASRS
jgi:hypothetical protein